MTKDAKIWARYEKLVGTKVKARGNLFGRKNLPVASYDVLAIRPSTRYIVNMKTMKAKHPCYELLLKNKNMKRSQWSSPFPMREINLRKP